MIQTTTHTQILTGNYATAEAVRLAGVQVVSAYPITPQSPVIERIMEFIRNGDMDAQFVRVESEHSAITVCISASATGARSFTASSANGLALMHEQLHWAAGTRLPIVLACVNRAVAAPWNILNDQQDSISQRDTGWIQIYCKNNQEIFDTIIQAFRLAESVYVPVMVCYDGYVLSHTMMPVEIADAQEIKNFLPPYKPHTVLDSSDPKNINPVTLADPRFNANNQLCHGYYELRYLLKESLDETIEVLQDVDKQFGSRFGRSYGLYEKYRCEDARLVLVGLGSIASEAMDAVDILREEGLQVGATSIRLYRPFPDKIYAEALGHYEGLAIFEKNVSYGYQGALASDLKAALYDFGGKAFVHSYVMGLGGRDVKTHELVQAAKTSYEYLDKAHKQKPVEWLNVNI